jgi:hypothetical protein
MRSAAIELTPVLQAICRFCRRNDCNRAQAGRRLCQRQREQEAERQIQQPPLVIVPPTLR